MRRTAASPMPALRALDLAPGTIALWWLGQAGFAVRAGGLVLLLDPFLTPMAERVSPPAFRASASSVRNPTSGSVSTA